MKDLKKPFGNLSAEQTNMLLVIFLATMLGTLGDGAFLRWATTSLAPIDGLERVLMALIATILHGGIVLAIFLWLMPQTKSGLRRLLQRR
jgi:hypothetical protein